MDLHRVVKRLDLSASTAEWLARLPAPAQPTPVVLLADDQAAAMLCELNVDPVDQADTLASRPIRDRDPELWWILQRMHDHVHAMIGQPLSAGGPPGWPALPPSPVARHLYVWLFLAAWPAAQHFYRSRQIPGQFWRDTPALADAMRAHRAVTGQSGLGLFDGLYGPAAHLRGAMYRLGLLEFNRGEVALGNGMCGHALGVHIHAEPLEPDRCDESFAQARIFFAKHFPDEPIAFFSCQSWLMDPQLADYLPPTSRIVQFQRRFHLLPKEPADTSDGRIREYIFGATNTNLDQLPQQTSLQRAYVNHLRSDRRWHQRVGWMPYA